MKTPERVVWSEGMFMAPQHMQEMDRYHEEYLQARLDALTTYDWGVVSIEVDERALAAGQLRFRKFVGVLPHGTPLAFDHDDPETPPARPIEKDFAPKVRALEVYLGVPLEREGFANYSEAGKGQRSRYVVSQRAVTDYVKGAGTQQVAFGQRNVTVLFGHEPRDDYEHMKVAEIVRDAAGAMVVCEPFVPPCLRISASPFIVGGLRRLLTLMVTKQRSLAESRRQRDASTAEFSAGDVSRFLLLNAINTFIPVVNYMVEEADKVPPHACYLHLAQFAGQLSSFSLEHDPSTLPAFVWTNLRTTFEEMFARLTALLVATVRERYVTITLDGRDDGLHLGKIEDDRIPKCTAVLLAVKTEVAESQVADQLPKLSKIASWTDINSIVTSATPGVPVTVTYRPPAEIPVKVGLVYFQLSTKDRFWLNILSERTVAVYLPPPFVPATTKLELLAVPPVEQQRPA